MPARLDALQTALEPLRRGGLSPEGYQDLGAMTLDVAGRRYIEIKYDLTIDPEIAWPVVKWQRGGYNYALQPRAPEDFFFDKFVREGDKITSIEGWVFGNAFAAVGGLVYIGRQTSSKGLSVGEYLENARREERVQKGKDEPKRNAHPNLAVRRSFSKAFLTIGQIPKAA